MTVFHALPRCPAPMVFAVFIIPTNFVFIREHYLPWMIPPRFILIIILVTSILILALPRAPYIAVAPMRLWAPVLGLGALMLLSLAYTPALEEGFGRTVEFWTSTILAYFAAVLIFAEPGSLRYFLGTLVGMASVLGLFLLMIEPFSEAYEFTTPLGSNYLAIQHLAGMAILTVLYHFLLRARRVASRLLWLGVLTLLLWLMVYVGGKGPVASLLLTLLVISATAIRINARRGSLVFHKRIVGHTLSAALIGGLVLTLVVARTGFSPLLLRFGFLLTWGHYSQVERVENAKVAMELFRQHPLLGAGIGAFSEYAVEVPGVEERFRYPHNILLEALAELGSFGFCMLSTILLSAFARTRNLMQTHRASLFPRVALSLLVFTFLNSLTSQNLSNPALFGFVGMAHAVRKPLPGSRNAQAWGRDSGQRR